MSDLDPAVVEQMVALVRACEKVTGPYMPDDIPEKARAISKLLPKPVDPDLLEMRAIYGGWFRRNLQPDYAARIDKGEYDSAATGEMILAALKRGRALAQRDAER